MYECSAYIVCLYPICSLCTHQVIALGWCSKKGLLATSGSDGTARLWNVTKSQYTLQQTCIFNKT